MTGNADQPVAASGVGQPAGAASPSLLDSHVIGAVFAVGFTAAAIATMALRHGASQGFHSVDVVGVLLVLAATFALALLRVSPLGALTVVVACGALHSALGYRLVEPTVWAALVASTAVAGRERLWRAAVGGFVLAGGLIVFFVTYHGGFSAAAAISIWVAFSLAWVLGGVMRIYRVNAVAAEERARLFAEDREARAREAVANERARLARELHDVVGHALNVVVIQAGAAQRVLDAKPDLAREALTSIETAGRYALADTERVLGILRSEQADEDGYGPQPGLSQLDSLVAQVTEAGLPVEVVVAGDRRELPSSIDLSAYRIVQEALTNTLKHAGPARARVRLAFGPGDLRVEVTDDGRGLTGQADEAWTGGRGLLGIKERVAIFGGELEAGPSDEGGFAVRARLPLGRENGILTGGGSE